MLSGIIKGNKVCIDYKNDKIKIMNHVYYIIL